MCHARTAKLRINEPIWNQSIISIHAGEQRTIDEISTKGGSKQYKGKSGEDVFAR